MPRLSISTVFALGMALISQSVTAQVLDAVSELHRPFYEAVLSQNIDRMRRILLSSPIMSVRDKIEGVPEEADSYFIDVAGSRCLRVSVDFLFANSAVSDTHSANAVRNALAANCYDIAQQFVQHGFDVNDLRPSSNSYHNYVLETFQNGNVDIMEFLVKNGIYWDKPLPYLGGHIYTHMFMAWAIKTGNQINMLERLIDSHGEMDPTATWFYPNAQGYNMLDVVHYRCGEADEKTADIAAAMLLRKGLGPAAEIRNPFRKGENRGRGSFACWSIARKDKFGGKLTNAVPAQQGPHKVFYP